MARYLSGIQASGTPHLGNYFGAIAQHVEQSQGDDDECLFFIADYHALTTLFDAAVVRENSRAVAATYLALGLNTDKAIFFKQSDIPEVTELTWMLSCCTGMGLLERAHSYKDKVAKGLSASVGLFTYPVLMASDILIYDSDVVPVGQDQVQHIEMTQDMATHFNARYGKDLGGDEREVLLKRPEWKLSPTPKVPGTAGEKMSKSYGNTIPIFVAGKPLKKAVNAIVTDSRPPAEPKDPDGVNAYGILALFLDAEERADWRARIEAGGDGAPGYGDIKKEIMARMDARFGEARERYAHLMETEAGLEEIEAVLSRGADRARAIAGPVLERCRAATGMSVRGR